MAHNIGELQSCWTASPEEKKVNDEHFVQLIYPI